MITGRIRIPLMTEPSLDDLNRDRRALAVLEACPNGAQVLIDIGGRAYVSEDAARWLHDHDHRLSITIQGSDPRAVATFVRAARVGEWSVIA